MYGEGNGIIKLYVSIEKSNMKTRCLTGPSYSYLRNYLPRLVVEGTLTGRHTFSRQEDNHQLIGLQKGTDMLLRR